MLSVSGCSGHILDMELIIGIGIFQLVLVFGCVIGMGMGICNWFGIRIDIM